MSEGSFARNHLEKYGWEQGKGLGRSETGITDPIKPKLKFDTAGIGHDAGEQFSFHWWDHVFNKAAKNIHVENNEDGVQVKQKGTKSNLISNKKTTHESKTKPLLYGSFVKHGTLNPSGQISEEQESSSSSEESDDDDKPPDTYEGNDEMLFKACGGRTAHKGARHGLHLSGKLQRIEEQENLHSNIMKMRKGAKNGVETEESSPQTQSRKRKKKEKSSKERSESDCSMDPKESSSVNNLDADLDSNSERKKKKKKKSKHIESNIIEVEEKPNGNENVEKEALSTGSNFHSDEFLQDYDTLDATKSKNKKSKKSKKARTRVTTIEKTDRRSFEEDEVKSDHEVEPFNQKKSKKVKKRNKKEEDIESCVNMEYIEDQCSLTKSADKESKKKRRKDRDDDREIPIIEKMEEGERKDLKPKKKKKKERTRDERT